MELDFSWLLRPFQRPERRFEPVTRPKPSEIPLRTSGAPIFKGVRSDAEYFEALRTDGGEDERIAMVFYGSSWCTHCERLFPHFVQAAKKNQEMSLKSGKPTASYVVAQVDYMKDAIRHLRYTPAFEVYRGGKRVDEYLVRDQQMMKDRMWLWAPDREGMQLQ